MVTIQYFDINKNIAKGLLKMLIHFLLLALPLLVSAISDYSGLTNPYLIPPFDQPGSPGVTQYLVFHSGLAANFTSAHSRCRAMGGDLADVESTEVLFYLASRLHGPAFVASWLGSHMGYACMAVFPGGAIAVPEEGCVGKIGSICEVPLFSTASIHIGASQASIQDIPVDLPDAKPVPVKQQSEATNPDGIQIFRDGKRVVGAKQPSGKTVTMTIYGSIATNPVLPCCKCC